MPTAEYVDFLTIADFGDAAPVEIETDFEVVYYSPNGSHWCLGCRTWAIGRTPSSRLQADIPVTLF